MRFVRAWRSIIACVPALLASPLPPPDAAPHVDRVTTRRVAAIVLGATTLSFRRAAESIGRPRVVTVTNAGTRPLVVSRVTVTGTNSWNFPETTTCTSHALAPRRSCTISVAFRPSLATKFSATVEIASDASPTPSTIALAGTGTGKLSLDTTDPTGWIVSNGALTLKWDSQQGNVWSVILNGTSTELVDTSVGHTNGHPSGLYEDDVYTSGHGGPVTAGYARVGDTYLDFWKTVASDPAGGNAFTVTRHIVVTANDPGFHTYDTVDHAASDVTGTLGQLQQVFRVDRTEFTHSVLLDPGVDQRGTYDVPLPSPHVIDEANADPGRNVQNAVLDLHGEPLPAGYGRAFETKYDYATQEYAHLEHGLYGKTFGVWVVLPHADWRPGGPTKQNLCFTDNILIDELSSNHLDNGITYAVEHGTTFDRLWGPSYYHFDRFERAHETPAGLAADARTYVPAFDFLYDGDATLTANGYARSTARGDVALAPAPGSPQPLAAWTVLSDDATNFQYSAYGHDYWTDGAGGTARIHRVVPGTYRLSSYVLGRWGELRRNHVVVRPHATTTISATFTPENFSVRAPIWTIGTPDRSAHEFLHGGVARDGSGSDDREYWGAWNYWADFAATSGAVVYDATAVDGRPATDDWQRWNYVQWGRFAPQLFGGAYVRGDDTTDGYTHAVPPYVASLPGASGVNGVATTVPPWRVAFVTTDARRSQGRYVDLSVGLAAVEASLIVSLNGHAIRWQAVNRSDAMLRSGLSGYYQWIVFEWPTAYLNAGGTANVLTFRVDRPSGVMYDALRMEISDAGANPAVTGWHDYAYVSPSVRVAADDAVSNNGRP